MAAALNLQRFIDWAVAMPVVTALEVNQRDKELVKLYLDDEFAMSLPQLEAAKLTIGQPLSPQDVEALADARAEQRAFDRAVRYLSYRPRSTEEVRRNLVRHQVADSLIASVLVRLERLGYLDDLGFAKFWLENRARFKPMGARALRYELRAKGIADEIIETLLAEFEEEAAAYRAAAGQARRIQRSTRQAFRRKLSQMLRRRGFEADTIREVVLRLERECEELDTGCFLRDAEE